MKAHIELQDLHFTPVFANMAVVNWYANLPGHFPSWGSSDAVTVSYSEGKVTNVTIHQPNAVAPYAFCEIAYTTLRQNFDQAARGQCVPTAVLAALATASPAGAIKLGLEMFWTGKPALADIDHVDPECAYIHHDMPPGIIPFKVGQPGALETGALKVACFGNQADCAAAEGSSPFTNAGFQGMWAIWMTAENGLRKSGDCKEENRNAWVTYPGMDEKHFKSVHDGMPPDRAFPIQIFMAFGKSPHPYEKLLDLIKHLFSFFVTMFPSKHKMISSYCCSPKRTCALSTHYSLFIFGTPLSHLRMPSDPVEASKALDWICDSENGALVFMAGGLGKAVQSDERQGIGMSKDHPWTLEGATFHCDSHSETTNMPDHAVYVDECYGDVVSMWTWTGRLYVHRHAVLLWGIKSDGRPCSWGSAIEGPRAQNFFGGVLVPTVSGYFGD